MPVTDAVGGKQQAPARARMLLLVDDDADLLDAIGDLVEQGLPGVKVLRATSGREGLGILQDKHVDGIIADFTMGDMDGLQFLCIARRCHPTIPRVMLTAHEDPALDRLAKEKAAVESFITKLIEPEDLLAQVRALLAYLPSIRPAP